MEIRAFQQLIAELYLEADSQRGLSGTYFWFMEEVGELTRALRRGHTGDDLAGEFADVFAWLASLANMQGIDLETAVRGKYLAQGRPGHHKDLARDSAANPGNPANPPKQASGGASGKSGS